MSAYDNVYDNVYDNDIRCERTKEAVGSCHCHGLTFCPDEKFSHYDDDQPVFTKLKSGKVN